MKDIRTRAGVNSKVSKLLLQKNYNKLEINFGESLPQQKSRLFQKTICLFTSFVPFLL
jgi:hypothetical protein